MHIPDGLMDPVVLLAGWAISVPVIAYAVSKVNKTVDEKKMPFMAILAAGIFVAQMLNFPVGGGTTGHLIGATLATILLGVYGSVVVMTVILVIQCLVFGDGGLTALGLNLLNMAVIAPFVAHFILKIADGKNRPVATFTASWASVFIAATACAVQLAVSFAVSDGSYGIDGIVSIPAMMGWHALIGIGEAIITVGVVSFLAKIAPEMLKMRLGEARDDGMEVTA
ncbi:MAG: energy-coupling factor ABC transporter permease [Methanomassiliicoccales archaeon]|nr:MAG: energy-coupling factor ABC transporter permease [Methanomassiliicoccales archaeon]